MTSVKVVINGGKIHNCQIKCWSSKIPQYTYDLKEFGMAEVKIHSEKTNFKDRQWHRKYENTQPSVSSNIDFLGVKEQDYGK